MIFLGGDAIPRDDDFDSLEMLSPLFSRAAA
jgi:hypothetical protein